MTQGVLNELVPFNKKVTQRHGTNYLTPGWNKGKVWVEYQGKIQELDELKLRFDMGNQQLEIKVHNTISNKASVKVLYDQHVTKFEYTDGESQEKVYFERCKNFKTKTPMLGFFRVLYKGDKVSLLVKIASYVQKGNEVKALGIGSANQRVIRKDAYFMTQNGKTFKIKRRKKSILKQFGDKQAQVKSYVKENKLYYKKEKDLIAIFKYYEGL
ncbi:MAG TPA: hypothetical protein DCS93_23880 [Microscillaceae bacterium]|nr:hypothetical protein [Microscillaceae bacterium]